MEYVFSLIVFFGRKEEDTKETAICSLLRMVLILALALGFLGVLQAMGIEPLSSDLVQKLILPEGISVGKELSSFCCGK